MTSPELFADSGNLKLVFSIAETGLHTFTTSLHSSKIVPHPLVPNTPLPFTEAVLDSCERDTTSIHLAGTGQDYRWKTDIYPEAGGFWVSTTLDVDEPVTLTPQLHLWLGTLDQLDDRQAHTWRQTILRAPTTNQQGLTGNDLPAGYLYDDAAKVATICYYPADHLLWLPQRLCQYTVREVFDYGQQQHRYGFGLLPTGIDPRITFPRGKHTLRWWFTQHSRSQTPSLWEAQRVMLAALQPLIDVKPTLTPNAISWNIMAQRTLTDLNHAACWTEVEAEGELQGLRAYVAGSSRVGRDRAHGFELMTQLDVLFPLLLWQRTLAPQHPLHDRATELADRLTATLPAFHRPDQHFVANHYPPHPNDSHMDTWYFMENALVKLPWVAHLTGNEVLKAIFFDALEGATTLAHNVGYLFPLFADARDWKARGSLLNVSVGGLYAAGQVLAYQLSGAEKHLDEAAQALRTLYQLPPHQLTHEPQQLSFGAAAAAYLARLRGSAEYTNIASDLMTLLLRMGYWSADPSIPYYDARGMFQACASLCYPAFKENVECLIAVPEIIRTTDRLRTLLASFANLQRQHNYRFFDPYLPADYRSGPCAYIPYEDLATAEFPHTATLGKELYGAGEVFWSALLFDSLAQCSDPNVLCLSLDVPCVELATFPPTARHRFLLYNPTEAKQEVTITTSFAAPRMVAITLDGLEMRMVSIDHAVVDRSDQGITNDVSASST